MVDAPRHPGRKEIAVKRWPIIRHIRYYWLSYRVHLWAMNWGSVGIGLGWPNESDLRWLDDIWRGKA